MKIGPVEITALARLAPMAGITNAPFRLIARECGSGLTTSEEMDAASLLTGHPHADAIAAYYPEERPLAMQLLGKDPDMLARAAERCQLLGADIVDLNMGCPMPKITGKGKGAALMRDVAATALILRALRKAVERAAHRQDPRRLGRRAPERGRGRPDGGGRGRGRHHRPPAHALAALHRPRRPGRSSEKSWRR